MGNFEKRTIDGGILSVPEKPTLKRLAELNGEPPWTLEVPVPDMLPDGAIDLIGAIRMGGAVFRRERSFREQYGELRDMGLSHAEACAEMGVDYDG